jgi:hypothetical protein
VPAAVLALALLVAAPTGARAVPRSFFGVVPQAPLEGLDYFRMPEAHVGLLRFQIDWGGIDPSPEPGGRDWLATDAVVGDAARQGIRVLPFLYSAPEWAIGRASARRCEPGCRAYPPKGPRGLAAWSDFVGAAVERYGPGGSFWRTHPRVPKLPIRDWQIWNEQNSPTFYRPRPKVRGYARLLAVAHEAIEGRDPGAKVILGGMFGFPRGGLPPAISAPDYLRRLYAAGGGSHFDGVAPHPYAARVNEVASQVRLLHDEIERAGDNASMWITEIGWASGGEPHSLNRGAVGQADRLRKAFEYFLERRRAYRIRTVDWYSWRDPAPSGPPACDWCRHSGLLDEAGNAKPAFAAFSEVAGAR